MRQLNEAGVRWVSRVSETSTQAQTILHEGSGEWQRAFDGSMQWFRRELELPQGTERLSSSYARPLPCSEPSRACNDR